MYGSFIQLRRSCLRFFFFFNDTATTEIYTLSLHDALPIFIATGLLIFGAFVIRWPAARGAAIALLIVAIAKCFFNDLLRLAGIPLVVSLAGLALSLVLVGMVMQKFLAPRTAKT